MTDFVIKRGILIKYTGPDKDVLVPECVKVIGQGAFAQRRDIVCVTIPEGVIAIGKLAFSGCRNLQTVSIPSSVIAIGDYAFYWCTNLRSATIPDGVTVLRESTFSCCPHLERIDLPESLQEIGDSAFTLCQSLQRIDFPNGLRKIGRNSFAGCNGLTEVSIPATVESIGGKAFLGCENLTAFRVDAGNRHYSSDEKGVLFHKDQTVLQAAPQQLSGCYAIPGTVREIRENAFQDCVDLHTVTFPEGLTAIGSSAFYGCTGLEEIRLPETVTTLSGNVFHGCPKLKKLVIPGHIQNLQPDIFALCNAREILAPHIPLAFWKEAGLTIAAVTGFLRNEAQFPDGEIRAEYNHHLLYGRKRTLEKLWQLDPVWALVYYGKRGRITKRNFETDYFLPAQESGAINCVAWLLEWKNKNQPQKEKKFKL